MSYLISDVINDAALAVGDPNKQRITIAHWTSIYNLANRELCGKVNILRFSDEFDLIAGQRKYDYPEGMVVMTGLRVSETPSDENSFRVVEEIFEDTFRERTDRLYPTGSLPDSYFATSSWFQLIPTVSVQITDGGCITYFGLPDKIPQEQVESGQVIQVPDFAEPYLQRRMVIYGLRARHRYAEAEKELALWNADTDTLQDKLDDRSQDKRSTLAPRRRPFAGMR